jgi:hypothetical protein
VKVVDRVALLKKMDRWLRDNINDEEIFMNWLYLMPDEATEDDYESIAENDEDFNECTRIFALITVLDS